MTSETKKQKIRTSLACNGCRDIKMKCHNDGDQLNQCKRCAKYNLDCTYTPTLSQIRKRLNKEKRLKNNYRTKISQSQEVVSSNVHHPETPSPQSVNSNGQSNGLFTYRPTERKSNDVFLPEKELWYEVADIFFKNQYQGIFPFIHKPSFFAFLRSSEFEPLTYFQDYSKIALTEDRSILKWPDPLVLLGILALCARLHPTLVARYGSFDEDDNPSSFKPSLTTSIDPDRNTALPCAASKYFGYHARLRLRDVFDRPTVQRVQALTMLSSHEWGEKSVARSFLYVGIAARMSLVLGLGEMNSLCYENEKNKNHGDPNSIFILQEAKRRTLWSVYMMDRCISSGRNRSSAIRVDDINICLPCSETDFKFGTNTNGITYQEFVTEMSSTSPNTELTLKLNSCSFIIVAFEIWAKIAKWVGNGGGRTEKIHPWLKDSTYNKLLGELNLLENMLPSFLQYGSSNLDAHIADNSAGSFGYLHCILLLCRVFLNREYFYISPDNLLKGWWEASTLDLLESIRKSSNLINTLSSLNLMVVAPFTGFEIFTNAGTALSFATFPINALKANFGDPDSSVCESLQTEFKEISLQNFRLLGKWGDVWTLATCWVDWILKMRNMFDQVTINNANHRGNNPVIGASETSATPLSSTTTQSSTIRNVLLDYGSPIIHDENDKSTSSESREISKEKPISSKRIEIGQLIELDKTHPVAISPYPVTVSNAMSEEFESLITPSLDTFDIGSFLPGWYDVMHVDNSDDRLS